MLNPTVREITRHGHPRGQVPPPLPGEHGQEQADQTRVNREQRELVAASLTAGVRGSIRKNGMGAL
ncbi:MAG: hypothetical protein QOD76_434 [Solirubrobacteraceae bacterium]|jgi:hypothetical protein|nr:hypothetical protein [Solirubrobacteraceae bacterium]